jgi:diguanylate cyclase (GGDEF)-like protein
MFKLFDQTTSSLHTARARADAFFGAKSDELNRRNQQLLQWMLPLYVAVLVFWLAALRDNTVCAVILCAALAVHLALSGVLFWWMRGYRRLKARVLYAGVLLFGIEILAAAALLDLWGTPHNTTMLYPLALVLMSQVYTLPPHREALILFGGAAGYIVLDAVCRAPALFMRDLLAVLGALMLGVVSYITLTYHKVIAYEEQKRLHYLCIHDPLTGVFNVSAFEQAYRTRFGGVPHLFAILDMDNFKEINDSAGHGMGDSVLMVFSAVVGEQLRANFPTSLEGRFGGDEFLIAAAGYDGLVDVTERLEKMQDAICRRMEKSFSRTITFSMGVVLCCGNDSFREVFGRSDREMYRAKEGGSHSARGRHSFEVEAEEEA